MATTKKSPTKKSACVTNVTDTLSLLEVSPTGGLINAATMIGIEIGRCTNKDDLFEISSLVSNCKEIDDVATLIIHMAIASVLKTL